MWDLPGPGLEPVSPAWAGGFFTTEPPGKPWFFFFKCRKGKKNTHTQNKETEACQPTKLYSAHGFQKSSGAQEPLVLSTSSLKHFATRASAESEEASSPVSLKTLFSLCFLSGESTGTKFTMPTTDHYSLPNFLPQWNHLPGLLGQTLDGILNSSIPPTSKQLLNAPWPPCPSPGTALSFLGCCTNLTHCQRSCLSAHPIPSQSHFIHWVWSDLAQWSIWSWHSSIPC